MVRGVVDQVMRRRGCPRRSGETAGVVHADSSGRSGECGCCRPTSAGRSKRCPVAAARARCRRRRCRRCRTRPRRCDCPIARRPSFPCCGSCSRRLARRLASLATIAVARQASKIRSAKGDVGGLAHAHQGGDHRHHGLALVERRRRPEIENARRAVQIPLARRVQFGQQVEGIVPLALPIAVVVIGRHERDDVPGRVDRLDLLALVGPVPKPVAVQPDVLFPVQRLGRSPL